MKYFALTLLVLLSGAPGLSWLGRVRERNAALTQAQAAYRAGDAAGAAAAFRRALAIPTPRPAPDPRLLLNLAHAQAAAGETAAARATYGQLLSAARVPARLGSVARQQLAVLAAGQGQYAQALSLLRQALSLDPANTSARYNYEVLREFLARQPTPDRPPPQIPTPPAAAKPPKPTKSPAPAPQNQAAQPSPTPQPGADRPGQLPDAAQPGAPGLPPQPRPAPGGQPNPTQPSPAAGAANGSLRAGAGPQRPLPAGTAAGPQHGLDAEAGGNRQSAGASRRPGVEQATDADRQLQTQRERLRQLNLTPTQARQLLEALRAQETQYLQQRPRLSGRPPRTGEPTW